MKRELLNNYFWPLWIRLSKKLIETNKQFTRSKKKTLNNFLLSLWILFIVEFKCVLFNLQPVRSDRSRQSYWEVCHIELQLLQSVPADIFLRNCISMKVLRTVGQNEGGVVLFRSITLWFRSHLAVTIAIYYSQYAIHKAAMSVSKMCSESCAKGN